MNSLTSIKRQVRQECLERGHFLENFHTHRKTGGICFFTTCTFCNAEIQIDCTSSRTNPEFDFKISGDASKFRCKDLQYLNKTERQIHKPFEIASIRRNDILKILLQHKTDYVIAKKIILQITDEEMELLAKSLAKTYKENTQEVDLSILLEELADGTNWGVAFMQSKNVEEHYERSC